MTHMSFSECQYIRILPDLLSVTPNLRKLDLRGCRNLVKIHDSNGYLDKLESWDLWGCIKLKILPRCIMMKSLKILGLFGCERVRRFPNTPQVMENLKYLSLAHTAITKLPPSFGNLTGLERLDIGSFFYSFQLPNSIYEFPICQLFLYGRQAPLNFLKKLTSCFIHSEKSKDLNLQESIIKFNRLHVLVIRDSKFLKKIPKLPEGIRRIYAYNCVSLNSESIRKSILQVPLPLLK